MEKLKNKSALELIGERVQRKRREMGLTQEQFADKYGYPRTTLAKLEAGLRDFKSTEILLLSEQLGVSCDYLLGLTDVKTPDTDIKHICEMTGLSENALNKLINHESTLFKEAKGFGFYREEKKSKPPKQVNTIIESSFFWRLVKRIWVLENIRSDDLPRRMKELKRYISTYGLREFIISELVTDLKSFLNRSAPYQIVLGDINPKAEADKHIEEYEISSAMYKSNKETESEYLEWLESLPREDGD
jgi:transcriptional regulator with XRE-family HTH domain